MSGKSDYEERRRLQAENDLLRERRENARLRTDAEAGEIGAMFMTAARAFLSGKATFVVAQGAGDGLVVSFRMPPAPDGGRGLREEEG
jgi:hypothetical protein